jgi:regulator of RNase E activity RraA
MRDGLRSVGVVVSLTARLELLDSCVVSDALDRLGLQQVVTGIAPLWACPRIVGPVRTVELRPLGTGETAPPGPHLGTRAIESSTPGDVVVVAHQGRSDSAGWGGLLSTAAVVAGIRGVLIDGACRDIDEAVELRLPLYARSATSVTARGRTVEAASGDPVTVDGVIVSEGDLVLADRSGVVFVPLQAAADVISLAEELADEEERMRSALLRGTAVSTVLGRRYETLLDDTAETVAQTSGQMVTGGSEVGDVHRGVRDADS